MADSYAIRFRASDFHCSILKKGSGLLMQSESTKADGTKSDLRIRWPKSSDFGPKYDDSLGPSEYKIEKLHRSFIKKKYK